MYFLEISVLFKLDLSQISFNPVKNAFATHQLAILATNITFHHTVTWACAEIKILRFLEEKVTYVFRLFNFWNFFFTFLFSPFLFFLLR